ncbi:MAG TPA: zinc ribbon domain-containing protein [Thermoplasmata archaeon]|nr:zinc ribbon domain-containing protein [Thermoplasmata archaeon]
MAEPQRPGTPRKCGACLSEDLEYLSDGSGKCGRCGSVTQPYWAARTWSFAGPSESRPQAEVSAAGGLPCPRCGHVNPPGGKACASCGMSLGEGAVFLEELPTKTIAQREGAARTKTGMTLLSSALLLSWIPVIEYLAGLLMLVGFVYVVRGRGAFGSEHARNGYNAAVLIVASLVGSVYLAVLPFPTALSEGSLGAAGAVHSWISTVVYGTLVVTALRVYALFLISFALQKVVGRVLLLGALAAYLAVGVLYVWTLSHGLDGAVAAAFSRLDADLILAVAPLLDGWRYFFALPSFVLAGVYFLAWRRVSRGDLPKAASPVPAAAT